MARETQARSPVCYWAVRELELTTLAVSRLLGICPTAVTNAVSRGQLFVQSRKISLKE